VNFLGLAFGKIMRRLFAVKGIEPAGWRWDYTRAVRKQTFDPHLDLDTLVFDSDEDEQLINTASFPKVDFFAPGDHKGCQCQRADRLMVSPLADPFDVFED